MGHMVEWKRRESFVGFDSGIVGEGMEMSTWRDWMSVLDVGVWLLFCWCCVVVVDISESGELALAPLQRTI